MGISPFPAKIYVTIFYVVKIKLFESRMTEQRMTCFARYLFAQKEPHPFQDTARLLFYTLL